MALSSIHPSSNHFSLAGSRGRCWSQSQEGRTPPQVILGLYRTVGAQFATFYATSVFLYSFRVKKGSGSLREYSNSRKSEPLDHVDFEIRPYLARWLHGLFTLVRKDQHDDQQPWFRWSVSDLLVAPRSLTSECS